MEFIPGSLEGKEPACNAGGPGSIPGEGNGNPLQYSCLDNPHAQRRLVSYIVHGVAKELDRTKRLTVSHFHFNFSLFKKM